jgi:phosphinothricin acetyltransferase
MEVNDYTLEILVREKLADARAMTARRALIARTRSGEAGIVERGAVVLRRAHAGDNAQIAAIWNDAVACTSLTTDTEPRTRRAQRAWLGRHDDAHPVIVAVDGDEVLAYGSLSPYRDKPAFLATVEDSVYVKTGRRGAGLGSLVLAELLRLAGERSYHAVMARIVADNEASSRLHARLGFALVGIERATAFKHGRWHDIAIYQLGGCETHPPNPPHAPRSS